MIQSAIKHLKYYGHRAQVELMQLWEYRVDTLSTNLGTYGYTLMTLLFIQVIFNQTDSIAGWTQDQILVLFGTGQMLFYLHMSIFWSTYDDITRLIRKGELDRFLLKPINSLFAISTDKFGFVELIPSFLPTLIVIRHGLINLNWVFNLNLVFYIGSFLISLAIYYCMYMLIALLSFWWTDTTEIHGLYHRIDELQNYPAEIYPPIIKTLFFLIIPVGIVAYAPTVFLIRGFQLELFLYQLLALFIFIALTKILWTKGLQNYSSASS